MRAALSSCLLVLALAGCGANTPPLSIGCRTHDHGKAVVSRITVRNRTDQVRRAILYGPALRFLSHMHPSLPFRQVVIAGAHRAFTGLYLPPATPKHPVTVSLRFTRPPRRVALALTQTSHIHAASWSAAAYPHCWIGRHT